MLRFYFHIDPKTLTEDEYFEAQGQLIYALEQTGQGKW